MRMIIKTIASIVIGVVRLRPAYILIWYFKLNMMLLVSLPLGVWTWMTVITKNNYLPGLRHRTDIDLNVSGRNEGL